LRCGGFVLTECPIEPFAVLRFLFVAIAIRRFFEMKKCITRIQSRRLLPLLLATALIACVFDTTPLYAQSDFHWDADGATTAATGGTGTWNSPTVSPDLWRSGSATGTLGQWANGNNAFLGGTAGIVTLGDGNLTVANLTISTSGYVIPGISSGSAKLTLIGATPTISVTTGSSTIGSFIGAGNGFRSLAGTTGLTLNGGGELILAAGLEGVSGGVRVTGNSILTAGDRNSEHLGRC